MSVSRRHLFGLLAGAAVAPHLPASAPFAQAAAAFNPQDLDRIWTERLFKEYARQSFFAPYVNSGLRFQGVEIFERTDLT